MYPFFTDIGKMKVSEALPLLEFIAADYNLDIAVLPKDPMGDNKYKAIWRRHAMRTATRILRNNQRNN